MKFSALFVVGFASLLFVLGCDDQGASDLTSENARLVAFTSCNELAATVKTASSSVSFAENGGGNAAPSASSGARVVGETNLQVADVDEIDTAKADGAFLYTLNTNVGTGNPALFVLRRIPGEKASVLQNIPFADMSPLGIFLTTDRLIAIGQATANTGVEPCYIPMLGTLPVETTCPIYTEQTHLRFFARNGDGTLTETGNRTIDGMFSDARMTGGRLHLVLLHYLYRAEPFTAENISVALPASSFNGNQSSLASCTDVLHERALLTVETDVRPVSNNLLCVVSADISDPSKEPKGQCILADGASTIYASPENLFVASWGWKDTPIHQFALKDRDERPRYVGTALVPGTILNQFSLDESNGYLRVATHLDNYEASIGITVPPLPAPPPVVVSLRSFTEIWTNQLSVFRLTEGNPILAATLGDLGKGEKIYATRFLGDKGFVVTFKKTDPLYAIDLSNPEHPVLRGELKIPGYSSYLHPMQDGYLLGVGKDAEAADESADFAWYQGMALSIFDVRDMDHPALVQKIGIGSRGTQSEALSTQKAFRYDPATGLVIFPIDVFEGASGQSDWGTHTFSGFHIYSVSIASGFELVGRSAFQTMTCEYCWYSTSGRAFVHDGSIALVGGGEVVTRAASSPNADLARVPIN
ncbi:MAG: beta-propeller domain-containing protein [Pseudomonadota bacterium]